MKHYLLIGLAAGLSLAIATGCSKKKPERTTPRARSAATASGRSVQVSAKGAKMLKCRARAGTRIVTLDLNRDKKRDRWILMDTKTGRKLCHEMDTDYDGKRDLSIAYFDDGITPRVIWWDLDYDGVFDQVLYNRPDGSKKRVEIRPYPPKPSERGKGWKPTIWKYYRTYKGKGAVIDHIEMDKDRNGYKDYWERYEDGRLSEVSWANPGDTDEKPKHWIEAPEEGQDKGFGGKDESGGGAPTKASKGKGEGRAAPRPAPRR